MSLTYTLRAMFRIKFCCCVIVASQFAMSVSPAQSQTWGGLYNMDKMLEEQHPFNVHSMTKIIPRTQPLSQHSADPSKQQPTSTPNPTTLKQDANTMEMDFFSEIRVGALLHDTGPFSASDEGGIDTNLELLFTPPKLLSVLGAPRPHLGISYNSSGDTSQAYVGLSWDWSFWGKWFAEFSLGGMVHDGHLVGVDGESKSLGCRLLFRESVVSGYKFDKHHSLMLHFDHSSNASLCKKNTRDGSAEGRHDVVLNEGLENLGIRYGYIF